MDELNFSNTEPYNTPKKNAKIRKSIDLQTLSNFDEKETVICFHDQIG